MLRWLGWLAVRLLVTFACTFTLWHVAALEYYSIPFKTLLIGVALLVVMIRFWAPKYEKNHDA